MITSTNSYTNKRYQLNKKLRHSTILFEWALIHLDIIEEIYEKDFKNGHSLRNSKNIGEEIYQDEELKMLEQELKEEEDIVISLKEENRSLKQKMKQNFRLGELTKLRRKTLVEMDQKIRKLVSSSSTSSLLSDEKSKYPQLKNFKPRKMKYRFSTKICNSLNMAW